MMKKFLTLTLLFIVIIVTFALGRFWEERRYSSSFRYGIDKIVSIDVGKHFRLYKLRSEGDSEGYQDFLLGLIDLDLLTLVHTVRFEPNSKNSRLICQQTHEMNDWFSQNDVRYKDRGLEQVFVDAIASCNTIQGSDS